MKKLKFFKFKESHRGLDVTVYVNPDDVSSIRDDLNMDQTTIYLKSGDAYCVEDDPVTVMRKLGIDYE